MDRIECGLTEIKLAGTDTGVDAMKFEGYGAVFNNVDSYGDVIDPGAFANFLSDVKGGRQPWPAMLSQHGGWQVTATDMTPIGVWTDFAEDGHGLKVSGQLADTPRGREMYALLKMSPRPAIDGLSIGYIAKESIPRSQPEDPKRRLKRIDLVEVSLVTRPANGKARITGVKSLEEIVTLADAERYLRDACGLSKSAAVALVSRIKGARRSESAELDELAEMLRRNTQIITNTGV